MSPHDPSPAASTGAAPSSQGSGRYRVFLSYSHADTAWAAWLLRELERFPVPARLRGAPSPIGPLGAHIAPVFRDRDELPSSGDLGEVLRAALRDSAALVVICSPAAARSRWVQEEILTFKRHAGSTRVFAFIVAGEPKIAGAPDDCFPSALRHELAADGSLTSVPAELVAADARPHADGRANALLRLAAGLLGVGYDDLRQRARIRTRNRRLVLGAVAAAGLGLLAVAWQARQAESAARAEAARRQKSGEELIAYMLDDLHTGIEKAEKLAALEQAGARIMAYFQGLDPRDLTDTSLAQQAKALTQIGRMRLEQMRYPDATAAFEAAFARLKALAARQPGNTELIFDRGQAEYWIGFVHRRNGQPAAAAEWFGRYRETGRALVALAPQEPRWQQELAYGHHNLAVLDVSAGRLAPARAGFLAAIAILERLAAAAPADQGLRHQMVDASSWLGSLAEQEGDLAEAVHRFAGQVAQADAIARAEPANARWKQRLADACYLHASALRAVGRRSEAAAQRLRGNALLDGLVASDPKNAAWQRLRLWSRVRDVERLREDGDRAGAAAMFELLRTEFVRLAGDQPKDPGIANRLAVVCRNLAEVRAEFGQPAGAAADEAVAWAEKTLGGTRPSDLYLGDAVQALVAAARLAGDPAAAARHRQRALALVEPLLAGSRHWRILFPAAHLLHDLGRGAESRELVARLRAQGFAPSAPWPGESAALPASS